MERLESGTSSAEPTFDFFSLIGVKTETITAFFSQALPRLVKANTMEAQYHLLRVAYITKTRPMDFFDLSGKTSAGELLLIKKNWELDADKTSHSVAMITGNNALFCFAMKSKTGLIYHFLNNRIGTEKNISSIISKLAPETFPIRSLWQAYSKASNEALNVPLEMQPDIGLAAIKRIHNVLTIKFGDKLPVHSPL